jgi:hypothetical protein
MHSVLPLKPGVTKDDGSNEAEEYFGDNGWPY